MNKFIQNLTANESGIKAKRANILANQAKTAQTDLINRLTREKDALDLRLDSLQDLAPDSTTSLKVGGENFNPDQWVKDVQSIKVQITNKKVELLLAEETFNEWFASETEGANETAAV